MEDLQELRKQIDQIDQEMVRLFEARMDVCRQVAEYKIANGKKVLDRSRELEKLDTLGGMAHNDFNRHGIRELFQQIMAMSRKLQYQLLEKEGVSGSLPFTRIDHIDRKHCRVVYQGVLWKRCECVPYGYLERVHGSHQGRDGGLRGASHRKFFGRRSERYL